MPNRKRRSLQQIMEDRSLARIREVLPVEWVIHDYKPDYGIDFIVEVFTYVDEKQEIAETLGELFFVQAKSIKSAKTVTLDVCPRFNVEKSNVLRVKTDETISIDVVKLVIETSELSTIKSMGAATPVLLFVVALDTGSVCFLCLNDYIDKVLDPSDPEYQDKGSKVIFVPAKNLVELSDERLSPLRFYARRSKMYAAFAKFAYQYHELLRPNVVGLESAMLHSMLLRFSRTALQQDIWQTTEWYPVESCFLHLKRFDEGLRHCRETNTFVDVETILSDARECWCKLDNLSRIYEELCREWFLPTFLAQLSSYSYSPSIHKVVS